MSTIKVRPKATQWPVIHSKRSLPIGWPQIQLGGVIIDLLEVDDAVDTIIEHARARCDEVLGVVSVNLDHLHYFGSGRAAAGLKHTGIFDISLASRIQWLSLLDGAPLVKRAEKFTGRPWPRLAGSDLIYSILDIAQADGLRIGFLGGSTKTQAELAPKILERWPTLQVAGLWAPPRSVLAHPVSAAALAEEIRHAHVDILVVCLGKPRQERWIAEHGLESGAKVCLAFGAVVDFLAGRVTRAPRWLTDHGLEWTWRLALEPRRLARRYLVQGPAAYMSLRRDSSFNRSTRYLPKAPSAEEFVKNRHSASAKFVGSDGHADVAALVVTHNNARDIDLLVNSLRQQLNDQTVRMIVADNNSTDGTIDRLKRHPDVTVVPIRSNLGYAGGINAARARAGDTDTILVLNPDLELAPNALRALRERLRHDNVGVAIPRLLDSSGQVYPSLRREPNLFRALGDAVFGQRLGGRPAALSEVEMKQRRYRHPHAVDWATGAALLIETEIERRVGDWDEQFFLYSEETDYLRRVRELGCEIWFEPLATMHHRGSGSGKSDLLEALMAVNRIRYHEKWHGHVTTAFYRGVVILGSMFRSYQSQHRAALRFLLSRRRWSTLPPYNQPIEAEGTF